MDSVIIPRFPPKLGVVKRKLAQPLAKKVRDIVRGKRSGAAVPERDQTSSTSTRSEMDSVIIPRFPPKLGLVKRKLAQPLAKKVRDIVRGKRSGAAVPERDQTSSTSTRSEMAPFSLVSSSSTCTLESPVEQRQIQEEDVPRLPPGLEPSGVQQDDSGPMTSTIGREDQLSGAAFPESEQTSSTTTRSGIKINNEGQEMINKISKINTPRSPSVTTSKSTRCIFKVPHMFVSNSYDPSVVSIGPYHHGKPQLMMIEEHKWRCLKTLLYRGPIRTLEFYLESIKPLERDARKCYSEIIQLESHKFIEMMVLDGCFIIELFRKIKDRKLFEDNDPLATVRWILPSLYRDLVLLENQIPFFILEKLFEISKMPSEESSLSLLAIEFFNEATGLRRPQDFICSWFPDLKGCHLLDLLRLRFIPKEDITQCSDTPNHVMHSFSKLRRSGIKLNLVQAESFLLVKFKNGVIEMPRLKLDEFMCSFLLNCLAFEQCYCYVSTYFTTYTTFLGCLVESANDVEYLRHHNIVDNNLGNDHEVARFINKMGKDVIVDSNCYLSMLFVNVDEYYRNSWNVQWTTFKHKYFETPWSFISALAAFVLLSLAIVQTFYTIMTYLHQKDEFPRSK